MSSGYSAARNLPWPRPSTGYIPRYLMLIDVSIYSPIFPPGHSVARVADGSLYPSSRPRYVLTPQLLSIRDSHGLSCDFGMLGGTYLDVGPTLGAFRLYADIFHNLAVLVRKFPHPLPRAEFPQKLHHIIGKGVGRVLVCSVRSVPSLHTSESGGVK
ncbi:hypothetical protein AZE42_11294 [Rhizopogon vesiculosus]|uniref:Uncharacterized protein n=1 Tax=Rhizopogon vesiculosus TaxID=180088 RepID=A0A1J8Q3X9_9AGAM|nr:hypothetical protein AZE42_11294 [Rhizopogon vesiculosus]